MFAPGLIATRTRAVTLVTLSAIALQFAGAAAGENRAFAETSLRKVPSSSWSSETSRTNSALRQLTATGRISDEQIRRLNLRLAMPLDLDQIEAEYSSLQVLQLRFDRRYGPESVASKSVRDRLELLGAALQSGRWSIAP